MSLSAAPPTTDPTLLSSIFEEATQRSCSPRPVCISMSSGYSRNAQGHWAIWLWDLALPARLANVLITALRAMAAANRRRGTSSSHRYRSRALVGGDFDVGDYIGLAASSPASFSWSTASKQIAPPAPIPQPVWRSFIVKGSSLAMEHAESARHLTMALAGRAKNVAPALADRVPMTDAKLLLDVGGGTGIYSIALLQKNPKLRAVVLDRPEVLKITQDLARQYGVPDRLRCQPFDMFRDPLPTGADTISLSNVLHDRDVADCQELVTKCASSLQAEGRLLIHDVFLNDCASWPITHRLVLRRPLHVDGGPIPPANTPPG